MEGTERAIKDVQAKIMAEIKEREARKEDRIVQTCETRNPLRARVAERLERHFGLGSDPEKGKSSSKDSKTKSKKKVMPYTQSSTIASKAR